MRKTYQYIATQHELGMAIGLDLQLRPMLKQFSRACMRRLGLAEIHWFALPDYLDDTAANDESPVHFLSVPEETGLTNSAKRDVWLSMYSLRKEKPFYINESSSQKHHALHRYIFVLGNIGYVELVRTRGVLGADILSLLTPIIRRLTLSCQAAIEHERLLSAIQARTVAENALSFLAFHDDLTKLPNRRLLKETVNKDIARARRHNFIGAVLYLDLNRFKVINDSFGHYIGDQLLISVAKLLKQQIRKEDMLSRLSGDEFVIQLTQIHHRDGDARKSIEVILDKIHHAFLEPIKVDEHALSITPSIGVELYPKPNVDADRLLHNADVAMYQAKKIGPNHSVFYDADMADKLKQRTDLEKDLQLAIQNSPEQFELVYQPQFNSSETCIGAEALLRWNHPIRGAVSPTQFIPIAEESGLMVPLGKWVMNTACEHLFQLISQGLPNSFDKLSVNVSAMQFNQKDFIESTVNCLRHANVDEQLLAIELTESSLIENIEKTVEVMTALRSRGIRISIDDFGTGYSSLAYLSQFPIDTLKIDQAFVRDIDKDTGKGNKAIVAAILGLGSNLGYSVIAEGVETIEEWRCLEEMGCTLYQGYYFSRPAPFDALRSLVSQEDSRSLQA